MKEFCVVCPKCNQEAKVTVENPYILNNAKLQCSNCKLIEKEEDLIRYNVIVKRNCLNCGKTFEVNIPNRKEKLTEMTVSCPNCNETKKYKPRNDKYKISYNKESPRDLSSPLKLVQNESIKNNNFHKD